MTGRYEPLLDLRPSFIERGSPVRVRQRALQKTSISAPFCMCSVGVEGHQARYGAVYGAFAQRSRSGERGDRVATGFRGQGVAEVGVERAALQPAGLVDGEQPFDCAFAAWGSAAERELAVDDGGAQTALGGVVGRLDIGNVGERPERWPELQEVLRERAHVPLPLACRAPLEQRQHLHLDRRDLPLQRGAVAVVLELLPSLEDVPGHLEPVEAERLWRAEAEAGGEGEVAAQMRPADLPPFRLEAVVSAEAIGANNAGELVADQPVQVLLATVRRDPQHRRLFAEGAPRACAARRSGTSRSRRC